MAFTPYITVFFPYRDGDHDELYESHVTAFERHDTFDQSLGIVESPLGSVELSDGDVPEITGMSYIEHYKHEGDTSELDLLYAPLIYYVIKVNDLQAEDYPEARMDDVQLNTLTEMVKTGYMCTEERPVATFVETPIQSFYMDEAETPPFTAASLLENTYRYLSWLTIFTPPMVETYGRETLLSAPAYRIEELDDGAILMVCHDSPFDHEVTCRAVAEHVGMVACEDV